MITVRISVTNYRFIIKKKLKNIEISALFFQRMQFLHFNQLNLSINKH